MSKEKNYVEVVGYGDRGDTVSPNNYQLEFHISGVDLLLDGRRKYGLPNPAFTTKEKANELAKLTASKLGIEATLAD